MMTTFENKDMVRMALGDQEALQKFKNMFLVTQDNSSRLQQR